MQNSRLFLSIALLASNTAVRAADEAPENGTTISVTIDASKSGAPINPFIYGQFIEHLGRCIYGGIWAEMLEDRKFYFPITDEYQPYRDLTDTKFPVVGASPWEMVSPVGSVSMMVKHPIVADKPFVGEQTPRISEGGAIRQNDLGLISGKTYAGYIWVLAGDGDATVTVSLTGENDDALGASANLKITGPDYVRHEFSFQANETTDRGRLEIRVAGNPVDIGTVSLMPADNVHGFRVDTLALLKQLNATMYRWPGGNFVSGYDWRDGVGPRDRRPPRRNPAWTGVEHNDVGLDEFLDLCREIGAEPMIAVNTGFGDDYSAAQEVEYVNGSSETIGGTWRAKNGHAKPYGVRYWCVGNEMWGPWQLGHMQLSQYTQKHNRVAGAMLEVDPNLVLLGSGDLGTKSQLGEGRKRRDVSWSEGMLEECGDSMQLISEHFYSNKRHDDVAAHVAQVVDAIRGKAEGHRQLQRKLQDVLNAPIPIAMDEWNYWHKPYEYGELGCVYELRDALGIAAGLHEYFRNSDVVQMAHYAQTVNVIGCIKTTKTAAFFDATALPLMLYRREFGSVPLSVSGNHGERALDIVAAKTKDGRAITIGVVNPNAKPQEIRIVFDNAKVASTATVWRIAGTDPTAHNTAEEQPVAIAEEKETPLDGQLSVPAYSINLYRVGVK